jgi:predicted DsbA family dithiol-disulfide isomerase
MGGHHSCEKPFDEGKLDFETNVLAEIWIEMIAARLGIDVREVHQRLAERMAAAATRHDPAEAGGGASLLT